MRMVIYVSMFFSTIDILSKTPTKTDTDSLPPNFLSDTSLGALGEEMEIVDPSKGQVSDVFRRRHMIPLIFFFGRGAEHISFFFWSPICAWKAKA